MGTIVAAALCSWCSILLLTSPAQAYLDPGSGSMFLQLLLGGVAGLTVLLKLFWHRLRQLFGLSAKEEPDVSATQLRADTDIEPHGEQQ